MHQYKVRNTIQGYFAPRSGGHDAIALKLTFEYATSTPTARYIFSEADMPGCANGDVVNGLMMLERNACGSPNKAVQGRSVARMHMPRTVVLEGHERRGQNHREHRPIPGHKQDQWEGDLAESKLWPRRLELADHHGHHHMMVRKSHAISICSNCTASTSIAKTISALMEVPRPGTNKNDTKNLDTSATKPPRNRYPEYLLTAAIPHVPWVHPPRQRQQHSQKESHSFMPMTFQHLDMG